MKISIRITGLLGLLLFSSLFGLTYGMQKAVEKSAKGFVKAQVEREIKEKYQENKVSTLIDKAYLIANDLGYEEQQIRESINNKIPEIIAEIIASSCGYDCEKKKALTKSITAGYMERIVHIKIAQKNLGEIIKGKYMEIIGNLRADLRIFLGINTIMFMILLLISFLKPQASRYLVKHFGLPVQNELTNATIDSFFPSRPASATIPYDVAHKWARHTTSWLPQ